MPKIDFPIPYDTRVDDKEVKKIEKYLDLARELEKVEYKSDSGSVSSWSLGYSC